MSIPNYEGGLETSVLLSPEIVCVFVVFSPGVRCPSVLCVPPRAQVWVLNVVVLCSLVVVRAPFLVGLCFFTLALCPRLGSSQAAGIVVTSHGAM